MPTLMLISSLAELIDATLTLISSAAEAMVLMFVVSCSDALATLDALSDACSLCDSKLVRHPGEIGRRAGHPFGDFLDLRHDAAEGVGQGVGRFGELADLVLLAELDASAAGRRRPSPWPGFGPRRPAG